MDIFPELREEAEYMATHMTIGELARRPAGGAADTEQEAALRREHDVEARRIVELARRPLGGEECARIRFHHWLGLPETTRKLAHMEQVTREENQNELNRLYTEMSEHARRLNDLLDIAISIKAALDRKPCPQAGRRAG